MDFSVTTSAIAKQPSGCIVCGVFQGRELSRAAADLDEASGHAIRAIVQRGDMEGESATTLLLHNVPRIACERVLLVGLGARDAFREAAYRKALEAAVEALTTTGATDATLCLHERDVNGRSDDWKIEQAVLAVAHGTYRFDRLKSKSAQVKQSLKKVMFHLAQDNARVRQGIARASAIAEGIKLTRDLGNMPGNLCTPTYLAQQAHELASHHGVQVQILEQKDIQKLGMGGLLAVARGSQEPPKLIVMEYHGTSHDGSRHHPARPVVLVGKGITFDAGGISIKPALELDEMKFDMCGAASVFGALHAAALMKLPIDIVGIIPATENMPDGNAIKPGDIVTTMSGQTVEILDTDAEGRVVLCDALTYASKFKPAVVIDVATLTGEIVSALGEVATGLFTNDDALAQELIEAGEAAWDRAWRMPLWDEYQETLKSNFADVPNIASGTNSAVTAACFLARFAKGYPWAHMDIAGTASKGGDEKGATGRPVALLAHFLAQRAAHPAP